MDKPVLGRKSRSSAQLVGWQRIGAQVEDRKPVAQPGAPADENASAEGKVGSEPAVHKDLPLDASPGRPTLVPLAGSTDGMPSLPLSTGHASDPTTWSVGQAVHTAADVRLAAHSPTHQVAVHLGRALDDGKTEIRIHLDPPDLGHVDIHMEFHDLRLAATISADRPETLDLLQRDARTLTRAFRDAGVELSGSGLSFAHSGQGGHAHANAFDEWTTGFVRVPRDVRGGPALEHAAWSHRSVLSIRDGRVDVRV
ncbi:MAG: flagellar hook-length control protein FliK [Geminicoccaceae bacterium]